MRLARQRTPTRLQRSQANRSRPPKTRVRKLSSGCRFRREVMSMHQAHCASSTLQDGQTAAEGFTSVWQAGHCEALGTW